MTSPDARKVYLSFALATRPEATRLQKALEQHHVEVVPRQIPQIVAADAFVLLATPDAGEDAAVENEIACALAAKSGMPDFVVCAVARLLGEKGARRMFLTGEHADARAPEVHVSGEKEPVESAVPFLLTALGLAPHLPGKEHEGPVSVAGLADLTIALSRPRMELHAGARRPVADVQIVYRPAAPGSRGAEGQSACFEAPLGAIEADDLRWYLEEYPLWPHGLRADRAKRTEEDLPEWGRRLFDATLGATSQAEAVRGWKSAGRAERRITVKVDDRGPPESELDRQEAAARLLALPWELLHDDQGYLFEGAHGARVRRRLPSHEALTDAPPMALPLRVLYVLSRPEGEGVSFLDPRASLTPLAEALDALGDAVELTVLGDGSFGAMASALEKGLSQNKPFHVVHFDGHGVYDLVKGLGALVFEDEEDVKTAKIQRKAKLVPADQIGATLRDHRVPLFVLEACQTAKTNENPQASVAAALLRAGVASVVAMSHSVLVSTARRFVEVFYKAVVSGKRVGTAMADAQRALKLNRTRSEAHDGSRLELDDWLVPVLFQEGEADPVLVPGGADLSAAGRFVRSHKAARLQGELPDPPTHSFVGRGRELLAIDRLLRPQTGLVLVGPGGLGKTALAVETARWLRAMRRIERIAFVSVETVSSSRGVVSALGEQLVPGYTIATEEGTAGSGTDRDKLRRALLRIEKALWETPALLVVDNLESVLPVGTAAPSEDVTLLFWALGKLARSGDTRVLLTSRETLPAGLWPGVAHVPLGALGKSEAVNLLAAVLRKKDNAPLDKIRLEQLEALIQVVGGHARSLVLLGEEVGRSGVVQTTEDVRALMKALEKRHPEQREQSLIASVRLSLRRLPIEVQRLIRPIGVFHGPANVGVIAGVLEIEPDAALEVCRMLVAVGLAGANGPYLLPDPALGAALADELTTDERSAAEARWLEAMEAFVGFLSEQQFQDAQAAFHGARQTLVDALAALEKMATEVDAGTRDAGRAMDFAVALEGLVSSLGLPRVLRQVSEARERLAHVLPAWSHGRFNAESEAVDRLLETGNLPAALKAAKALRDQAEQAGDVYPEAGYDRAMAWLQLGRVLRMGGAAGQALGVLREAEKRFAALAAAGNKSAARMESASITEQGDALRDLGQLDEAAAAYEKGIQRDEALGDARGAAVGRGQLGTVRLAQGRLAEALAAYVEAREAFEKLGEPGSVAVVWHQIGRVHEQAKHFEAAEAAYRQSLALKVAQANKAGEALTLGQLGSLYDAQGRLEEAATYHRKAADLHQTLGDKAKEGLVRSNLGITLRTLGRFDEAREALKAAIALREGLGHAAEPWKTWWVLADVERDAGRPTEAAEAREKAMATYSAYREDGGEPMDGPTRLIAGFGEVLRDKGPERARELLAQIEDPPAWLQPILRALEAMALGDNTPARALIADPAFAAMNAVELSRLLAA